MNRTTPFSFILCSAIGLLSSTHTLAEVTSLTTSELTETYIKDSTIIVTPKKEKKLTEKKVYSSLTIAPIENNDIDFDKLHRLQRHIESSRTSIELTDDDMRQANIELSLEPDLGILIPTFQELTTRPIAEILDDPRYTVPEGDFDFTYIGGGINKDLGLSRQDKQLTFSIGNLPGIEKIKIPEAFNEGPLQIIPRAGGGFDLTINVPENN